MKTIGLIGGMSWESTVLYYQLINQGIKANLGGLHSAKLILISVDFAEIEALQTKGDWISAGNILADAAKSLEQSGAQSFLICTNTMHKVVEQIESQVSIPNLHIADQTADILVQDAVTKVALLGTAFTMEQTFYRQRIEQKNINVITPNTKQRQEVHRIIYGELCLGKVRPESVRYYQLLIDDLISQGAEAIILGCTEIGLLIQQQHSAVKVYDTTLIHAQAAVKWMLEQ